MAFRSSAAYLAALRAQRPVVYCGGELIPDRATYEGFAPTRHCWGTWIYDCVRDPEVQRTLERIVSIDGAPCHPFWSIPATREDLLDNILVARQVSRVSPAAGYATIGRDELAALYVVATALGREGKGEYLERVRDYVRRFQREQLMTSAAITDPKGDRRLRPAEQPNKEAYLRVVEALRRDRRSLLEDAHVRRGRRRGPDRGPDPRDAEGGRRLRGLVRHPGRRPRPEAHRPRGAGLA
jgi:4-hydroxybutyryl-CoA dehydratase/vinylacetyl-CoA-Delta-isomerase